MRKYLWLTITIIISITVLVRADYLQVSRLATIKAEPQGSGTIIERVEPGIALTLLDNGEQTSGYYKVKAPVCGQDGWIYRTFVRRYAGDVAESEVETETPAYQATANPLSDPSYTPSAEELSYALRHLKLGKPQAIYERARKGYVTGVSASLKIPLWVQYELASNERTGDANREDSFREDASIPASGRAKLSDYRGSGYDRGHMAPANDMKRSEEVMSESFLLSNMCPQVGEGFNQEIWKNLEQAINDWVGVHGSLTIITGPIFKTENGQVKYSVIGANEVAVPTHFYKIVVDANNSDSIRALAFILPNTNLSRQYYGDYLCSIDEIEKLTGLDFLANLPDNVENELEESKASQVW